MDSNGTAGAAFDLLAWISSGTEGRRNTTIYNDPALVTEFEELDAERARLLRDAEDDPESTLGTTSGVARIESQMEDLYERFEASKSTWTIRALPDDEIDEINRRFPIPDGPEEPREPKNSPKGSQAWHEHRRALAEYKQGLEKHLEHVQQIIDERNLHFIAAAVVQVQTTQGTAHGVTYEQMRALRAAPYGKVRTDRLISEILDLTKNEPAVPAPKSRAPRLTSQD